MQACPPPAELLPAAIVNEVRQLAPEADEQGHLLPAQLELIYACQWFNIFVPKSLGGLELSFPEALKLEEALAWADGSFGWTITLCAGAGWFVGFLDPALSKLIFSNPKACLAGSGKSSGLAIRTDKGYRLHGYWPHASGAHHATAFTANCQLEDGGKKQMNSGDPLVRPFVFLREEVQLEENWHTAGMRATGSVGFRMQPREIPANRIFEIDPARATLPQAIYQYPFLPFAEATLAVNYCGMALRFLELCGTVDPALNQVRDSFFNLIEQSWQEVQSTNRLSASMQASISRLSRALADRARQVVHERSDAEPHPIHPEWTRVRLNMLTAETHPLLTR